MVIMGKQSFKYLNREVVNRNRKVRLYYLYYLEIYVLFWDTYFRKDA